MEGVVLDDPVVYQCQCGSEEFFAGGAGAVVIFLFDRRGPGFHPGQAALQCAADVADERGEPGFVLTDAGQSHGKSLVFCADQLPGRSEPEPGIYPAGGDRCPCAAECGIDGYFGLSAGHSPVVAAEPDVEHRLRGRAPGRVGRHGHVTGGIGSDAGCTFYYSFSFSLEGLTAFGRVL
jgi:hypothetical protein